MGSGSITAAWREALASSAFRIRGALSAGGLVLVLTVLARFLEQNEGRPGVVLPDPVLALFSPVDLTWLTFALIYIGLVAAVVSLLRHPETLLLAIQAYSVMVGFRIIAMTLVPLEPPVTMIPLQDPLVEYFGTGTLLTKDLFFSGHTSTLFLLFLVTPRSALKKVFLACTVLVACCVILQHVHYAIDVYVAPFVAYAAYRIVLLVRGERSGHVHAARTP